MRYSIFDPTGNITALVESDVPVCDQPAVAATIMERHPDVEQVGFVRLSPFGSSAQAAGPRVQARLRMAGGEFCGNASMCAACLFALRTDCKEPTVWLGVSGTSAPVRVDLVQKGPVDFDTSIQMPGARQIEFKALSFDTLYDAVPIVHMEGIFHAIVRESSPLFALHDEPRNAEKAIKAWCRALDADGLGIMFLEGDDPAQKRLTPLVYVPGGDTVFWEHSCASGSSAVGMHAVATSVSPVSFTLHEPGGTLRVEGDPCRKGVTLYGSTRLVASYQ